MPPIPDPAFPATLLHALSGLSVSIEGARCVAEQVRVPSYPGGVRPSSTVHLRGGGVHGVGEHVAWSSDEHERLGGRASTIPLGRWELSSWVRALGACGFTPYETAAIEAAGIDLALRQRDTNLFLLTGVAPEPVSYVLSFDARRDPASEVRRWLAVRPDLRFKIDVDPSWDEAVYHALARLGAVATLDFKGKGDARDHERAHRILPGAMLEDPAPAGGPWSRSLQSRLAFDAPVTRATDIDVLTPRPAAINLKAPRMGGFFEMLRCAAVCAERSIPVYFGGMFEVGVGRRQLWALAALLAPEAANDLAPIARDGESAKLPRRLVVDPGARGFAQ